jgi:hypothetical protein
MVVGTHMLVLSPVRGGDAAARHRLVVDDEARVVLVASDVVLEHQRVKASKEGPKKKGGKS